MKSDTASQEHASSISYCSNGSATCQELRRQALPSPFPWATTRILAASPYQATQRPPLSARQRSAITVFPPDTLRLFILIFGPVALLVSLMMKALSTLHW